MLRLFVNQLIELNKRLTLDEKQTHYLANVMKAKTGDRVGVFDGKTGEYECKISEITRKSCSIEVVKKLKEFYQVPDVWLLFAPLKKDNTDFIIEKATELGARKIMPVITQRTISEKVKLERFVMQSIEASEQCGRLDLPEISDALKLEKVLKDWDKNRVLFFMDESRLGKNIIDVFEEKGLKGKSCAILVGPEGGFTEAEFAMLRKLDFVKPISLGKRILRAETAAITALSCFQATLGDF